MDRDLYDSIPPEESKLPNNVKQIGTVDSEDYRIYIEDYVYSYLNQYSKSDLSEGKVVFLVGKQINGEDNKIILISGAIKATHLEVGENNYLFTDQTLIDVEKNRKNYFPDKNIMGWMNSQPGYGVIRSNYHMDMHYRHFSDKGQILFVVDPIDKSEALYIWESNDLKKVEGYFIYYERNTAMHNYMITNKVIKSVNREKVTTESSGNDILQYRRRFEEQKEENHLRKLVSMLTSLTAILVVVCIIMASFLLKTDQKLQGVQGELDSLKSTMVSLEDSNSDKGQAVNASVNEGEVLTINEGIDMTEVAKQDDENQNEDVEDVESEEVILYDVPDYYIIRAGDNLNSISMEYYGTTDMVDRIVELNGLKDKNQIYAGKKLILPKN